MLIKCPECELQVIKLFPVRIADIRCRQALNQESLETKTTSDAVYQTGSDRSAKLKTVISVILSGRW